MFNDIWCRLWLAEMVVSTNGLVGNNNHFLDFHEGITPWMVSPGVVRPSACAPSEVPGDTWRYFDDILDELNWLNWTNHQSWSSDPVVDDLADLLIYTT